MTRLRSGAATDVGLARANNQDQLLVAPPIYAVADGMGGHAAGEVASSTAVDALRDSFAAAPRSPDSVVEAARAANWAVWDRAQSHAELRGMGTTLTAIALVVSQGEEVIAIVNVGDSRTYRFRDGALQQMTVDHSYVAELIAGGQIDEAEAEVHPQRHVLTRALGVSPDVEVDLLVLAPRPGDRYLLCSDGLSREVSDAEVAATLARVPEPGQAARQLVTDAKHHGGNDNITVVVVDVVGDEAGPGEYDDDPTASIPVGGAIGTPPGPGANGPSVPPPVAPQPIGAPRAGMNEARRRGPRAAGGAPVGADGAWGRESGRSDLTTAVRALDLAPDIDPGAGVGSPAVPSPRVPPLARGPGGPQSVPSDAPVRGRRHAARTPRHRLVTFRVAGFVLLLVVILAVAAAGTEYYARDAYFVGLRGTRLTIFQGRPGGVLWWKPTIAQITDVTTADVEPYHLASLRAGVPETGVTAARTFVSRLQSEKTAATAAGLAPATTPAASTPTPVTSAAAGAGPRTLSTAAA